MPAARKPDPVQPDLPVTPAVEQPILNSPYYEPEKHWVYGKDGKATRMPGRRPATYFWTTQRTGSEQMQLEGITSDYGAEDMPVINALREDVGKWRKSNYENATQTTRQLLRHWHSKDRKRRLFFCQLEAAETIIYLDEFDMAPTQLRPLINQGRVLVTNWHAFAPESPHAEGGATYKVVDKGEERPDAFARRVLGDLYGRGKILVMNDEAHHAYRPKPATKNRRQDDEIVDEASTED